MTPQEEQLLGSLIERVNRTRLEEKDPDAQGLLDKSLATNPDALYILTQTVLVQNIALEQARARVAELEQQAQSAPQQPARATSFLGSLLGHRNPSPTPSPVQAAPQAGYQPVSPQYAQSYPQPEYVPPQYAPGVMTGPPSFLRGAMQTAAGVAAGALAFEGVESILHGFGHSGYGWGGPGLMGGGGLERPVEVINNNYYDDARSPESEHHGMEAGEHHFHESADQDDARFNDASYNAGSDRGDDDFSNSGDAGGDFGNDSDFDSGSGDDGGGFDGGSGGDLL